MSAHFSSHIKLPQVPKVIFPFHPICMKEESKDYLQNFLGYIFSNDFFIRCAAVKLNAQLGGSMKFRLSFLVPGIVLRTLHLPCGCCYC